MAIKIASNSSLRVETELVTAPFSWPSVFGREGQVEVEIGIGKGRFLLAAAEGRPEILHFGVEWANEFLRIAESRAEKRGLENVRFARIDAVDLVQRGIPEASVAAYYVFYPDPWPKKRHHKRRFLQQSNVDAMARTLVPGGWLHVATDHDDYWAAIEPVIDGHAAYERQAAFGGEAFPLPVEAPLTNFEAKYEVEGRSRHRATWRRSREKQR